MIAMFLLFLDVNPLENLEKPLEMFIKGYSDVHALSDLLFYHE